EHEAPFGVRVDDLDSGTGHRRDDVAGTLRIAVGHVLDDADGADRIDLGLARSERLHQPDDTGGAGHVALHVLHARRRLDRNATGVEAHALADERHRRFALLAAIPAHENDATRMRRALPDAEQSVHAELLHRWNVEHVDADAELPKRRGAPRKFFRIEDIRGLVDEIARKADAAGDRFVPRPRLAHRCDVIDRDGDV